MLRRSRASCNFKPRGQRVANLWPEMKDQEGMGPRQVMVPSSVRGSEPNGTPSPCSICSRLPRRAPVGIPKGLVQGQNVKSTP